MEWLVTFAEVAIVGVMWDRIRRLEKAVARINPTSLKEVKSEEASRNYW